jgi:nuclear pore complex protein Nup155
VQGAAIHSALYANGLTIAPHSVSEEIDRILCIMPEAGATSKTNPRSIIEMVSYVDIEGTSWAICEAPTQQWKAMQKPTEPPGFFLNELVTQLEYPSRKFFVLTNSGLTVVAKRRPLDILLQLLPDNVNDVAEFAACFGDDQFCAMCLAVACGHSSISEGPYGISKNVLLAASSFYFEMGGVPVMKQTLNGQFNGVSQVGVPIPSADVQNSAKHAGLALYLARALRPVWRKQLFKKDSGDYMDQIVTVQLNLQSLNNFLNQYPNFTAIPLPETRPLNVDPEAWKREQQSLHDMHCLIVHAGESLSFISLIIDSKIENIAKNLSAQDIADLEGSTFESFISTPQGRQLSKSLMSALVNTFIDKEDGLETIISQLKQKCPTICNDNDTVIFKGLELVQNARATTSPDLQETLLRQALDTFRPVLSDISIPKLVEIVESFKLLGYFTGVVDLVLEYTSHLASVDATITTVLSI